MSDKSELKIIDTPSGAIQAKVVTAEPELQEIKVASSNDIAAFNAYAAQGPGFVSAYLKNVSEPTLDDYDAAFNLWQSDKNSKYTDEKVLEILGSVLGNKLVADFDMQWVIVSDEHGDDYGVRARRMEVIAFPFSSAGNRIDNGKPDFMYAVYHTVKSSIENYEGRPRSDR